MPQEMHVLNPGGGLQEPKSTFKSYSMEDKRAEAIPTDTTRTDTLTPAGINTIHLQPKEEVAVWLTNVLKMRKHVKQIVWNVGKDLVVTYQVDLG